MFSNHISDLTVGSKGIKRKPKIVEEEDIGEFPCPVCNEIYDRVSLLDKHAKEVHPGLKVKICYYKIFNIDINMIAW